MIYVCRCLYCNLLKQKKYIFKHMGQQDDIRIGNYFSIASHTFSWRRDVHEYKGS